ncbi:MAG: M28 family peptidase [Promethearchaeota archaeon]
MSHQNTQKYANTYGSITEGRTTAEIFENKISEIDVNDTLSMTKNLIDKFGPRLTGNNSTKLAAENINELLSEHCDTSKIETFKVHRESFMAFMKIFAVSFVISSLFFFLGENWTIIAVFGYTFATIFALLQFVLYKETFDPLFRKFTGYNVIGSIKPSEKVKQRIIVQGHHDSAYVMNFLSDPKTQKMYAPRIFTGLFVFIGTNVLLIILFILELLQIQTIGFRNVISFIILAGAPAVFQFFFFKSNKVSPGAGDNLIASMIAVKIGQIFGKSKMDGQNLLKHTEIVLVSSDAEESALRGARAYVKKHIDELKAIPTYVFNIDSLYSSNDLSFLTADINGFVKLSSKMAQEGILIANSLGYTAKAAPITFGGGGTDAAEYARYNIEATTILGMENTAIRDGLVYHTLKDTVDSISPSVVKAVLEIVYRYILYKEWKLNTSLL